MSNELKLFSGSANTELAREMCGFLGCEIGKALLTRFSDGEIYFQIDENVRGADVFIVQPSCTPVDSNLMELFLMIDAFKRASARRITAVMRRADARLKASIIKNNSMRLESTGVQLG